MTQKMEKESEAIRKQAIQSQKFRMAVRNMTMTNFNTFRTNHPEWPLTTLIAEIIKNYNPEIPASLLLEMTHLICEKWEAENQKAMAA